MTPRREPSEGSLSVERVLTEEYECLHGPLNGQGGLGRLYEAIQGLREKRSALCLSGGGIRSATFALGVLQGLAKVRVYERSAPVVDGSRAGSRAERTLPDAVA